MPFTATSDIQILNQTRPGDQEAAAPFVYEVGGVDRFGVVWQSEVGGDIDLFVRSLGVGGFALGSEQALVPNRLGDQLAPDVTVLANGQVMLAYVEATGGVGADEDGDVFSGQTVRGLSGTPNGSTPFGGAVQQLLFGQMDEGLYADPELTALSNGTVVVTVDRQVGEFGGQDPEAEGLISLRAVDGMLLGAVQPVLSDDTYFGTTAVAELANGNLYTLITQAIIPPNPETLSEQELFEALELNVLERFVSGTTAAPLGEPQNLTPDDFGYLPELVRLVDGRIVGTVEIIDDQDGSTSVTYGSLSSTGVLQNDLALLSERENADNETVSLAATPDGGFVAVWEANGIPVIRRFDVDLTPVGDSVALDPASFGFGSAPKVAITDAGQVLVTWSSGANGDDVFARTYTLDDLGVPGVTRTGTPLADQLVGTADDDTLTGLDGADVLDGRGGADVMAGGLGNDFYLVDTRADQIVGEIAFSAGGGIDTVRSFVSYTQPDNIELVRLGFITGGADLNATGNDAPGTLVGNAGDNILTGRGGNDQLNGNNGADVITGNTGRDTLVGGNGADTFIYTAYADSRAGGENRDLINGFERGALTRDVIDLSQLDANTRTFGVDDAFAFIGGAGFSGTAGELRTQALGGPNAVLIEADHNGDGTADLQIFVNLQTQMFAGDFIL